MMSERVISKSRNLGFGNGKDPLLRVFCAGKSKIAASLREDHGNKVDNVLSCFSNSSFSFLACANKISVISILLSLTVDH